MTVKINPMTTKILYAAMTLWFLTAGNASATNWYVRDGGGTPSQCTGTTNAVSPRTGNNQPCALSNPMYVLGAGCGNTGWNNCDVSPLMADGDTLSISGDSDITPGAQAQYPIGLDVNGIITPVNGNNCFAPAPENCTMANLPPNSTIIGTGTHRPQLWAREQVAQVLNDNNSTATTINNLEITQHSSCVYNGADPQNTTDGFPNRCQTPSGGFSSPFGNWGLTGISLSGAGITLENSWIHGMGQWGITTGSLSGLVEQNNIINETLLVKTQVPNADMKFRNAQQVHARVVWSERKATVIPITAVTRLSGKLFAFVAEGEGQKAVARQRVIQVGDLVGNDYVVLDGINAGDKIIVTSVQMLADGMPVVPQS